MEDLPVAPPHWRDNPNARCIGCDAAWNALPPYNVDTPSEVLDELMLLCEYDGQNYMMHKADCPWLKMMNQHNTQGEQ